MDVLLKNIIQRKKLFAIDISPGSIKVLEFEKKKDIYKLKNIGEEEIPSSTFIAGIIRQPAVVVEKLKIILEKKNPKKIKTNFAVVIMPDDQIYSQVVSIPKVEKKKIYEALLFQLPNLIPMKEDDIYWTYDILSEEGEMYDIVVTAVIKESADSFIETLKQVKIVPLAFESRAQSALRAITLGNKEEGEYILLDIEKSVTSIAINKKDAIQFSTSFYFGLNQILKTIGEYKKINDAEIQEYLQKDGIETKDEELQKHIDSLFEQVIQELTKAINFYGEDKISKIYLYGETATVKGVLEKIQKSTKVPIEKAKSNIRIYPIPQWEKHEQISPYIPLVGAELINKIEKNIYINLLPQKEKSKAIRNYFLNFSLTTLKLLILNLIFLSFVFVFLYYTNTQDISNINSEISIYQSQLKNPKYKGVGSTIDTINTNLSSLQKIYSGQYQWSYVVSQIANLLPPNVHLTNLTIENIGKSGRFIWQVSITGTAQNATQILALEKAIVSTSDFSNLTMPISNFQKEVNPGFLMTFTYTQNNNG